MKFAMNKFCLRVSTLYSIWCCGVIFAEKTSDHLPLENRSDHLQLKSDHLPLKSDHLPLKSDHLPLDSDHLQLKRDHLLLEKTRSDHLPLENSYHIIRTPRKLNDVPANSIPSSFTPQDIYNGSILISNFETNYTPDEENEINVISSYDVIDWKIRRRRETYARKRRESHARRIYARRKRETYAPPEASREYQYEKDNGLFVGPQGK